jgi:hypothetical protein
MKSLTLPFHKYPTIDMPASRDTPVKITKRQARFSSQAHDEVELIYPLETLPDHQDYGTKQTVFYSADRYEARGLDYGPDYYPTPDPFTDGRFIR